MNTAKTGATRLAVLGWGLIFGLAPLGNSSLGILLLLSAMVAVKFHWPGYSRNDLFSHPHVWFTGFLASILASIAVASQPGIVFGVAVIYALLLVTVILGSTWLATQRDFMERSIQRMLRVSAVASVVGMGYFIQAMPTGYPRAHLFSLGENGLGSVLMVAALVALCRAFTHDQPKVRIENFVIAAITLIGLLLTFSRGAWLALVVGLVLVLTQLKPNMRTRTLIAGAIVAVAAYAVPSVHARIGSIFNMQYNWNRMELWRGAWRMFLDHPILGVGGGNFSYIFPQYLRPDLPAPLGGSTAHNFILTVLAEYGLVGFIWWAGVMISVFVACAYFLRQRTPLESALAVGFVGFFAHQLVDHTAYALELGGLFWSMAGYLLASYKLNNQPRHRNTA